jgi:hypothetical protein
VEDLTVRIGLLMEAVESQRDLTAGVLERLERQVAGLDEVVRDQIRATLAEELGALTEEGRRAAQSLRGLGQLAHRRVFFSGIASAVLAALIPLGIWWWLLPSPAELDRLRATRDGLAANVARLTEQGGRVQLRRCGAGDRLCVRIERAAPAYGEGADYAVIKGY